MRLVDAIVRAAVDGDGSLGKIVAGDSGALSDGDVFSVDETWLKRVTPPVPSSTVALNDALLNQEKEMIEAALTESRGRISGAGGAASKLRIPARTLDSKIKRLGINIYRFKGPQS